MVVTLDKCSVERWGAVKVVMKAQMTVALKDCHSVDMMVVMMVVDLV